MQAFFSFFFILFFPLEESSLYAGGKRGPESWLKSQLVWELKSGA